MRLNGAGRTSAGTRLPLNNDAFLLDTQQGILAVADGLGGRPAGHVASGLAIEELSMHCQRSALGLTGGDGAAELGAAVEAANARIWSAGTGSPEEGMATTLTAVAVAGGVAHFAHVGDSRGYHSRDGALRQLTQDHTAAALRKAVRGSASNPTEAIAGRRLLAALGLGPIVGPDLVDQELRPGDLLLLCTDGLTAYVGDDDLRVVILERRPLTERCQLLVDLARGRGSDDDVTVVLAEMEP